MGEWLARVLHRRIGVIVVPFILALFKDKLGIEIPKEAFDAVVVATVACVGPVLALVTLLKKADTRSFGTKLAGAVIPAAAVVLAQFGVVVPEELQASLALQFGLLFEAVLMALSASRPRPGTPGSGGVPLKSVMPALVLLAVGLGLVTGARTALAEAVVAHVQVNNLTNTEQPLVAAALASETNITSFVVTGGAAAEVVIFRAVDNSPEYFRVSLPAAMPPTVLPGMVVGAEGLEIITADAAGDVKVVAFVGRTE